MPPNITVYTQPGCATCAQLKQYLDGLRVSYRERDVSRDAAARLELEGIPGAGLPVTVIEGEAVLGFDRARLADLLKARGVPTGSA